MLSFLEGAHPHDVAVASISDSGRISIPIFLMTQLKIQLQTVLVGGIFQKGLYKRLLFIGIYHVRLSERIEFEVRKDMALSLENNRVFRLYSTYIFSVDIDFSCHRGYTILGKKLHRQFLSLARIRLFL